MFQEIQRMIAGSGETINAQVEAISAKIGPDQPDIGDMPPLFVDPVERS